MSCKNQPADIATQQYQGVEVLFVLCKVQTRTLSGSTWLYGPTPLPINVTSALSSFAAFKVPIAPVSANITLAGIGANYTDRPVLWDGCVEEQSATSDINQVPDPSKPLTQYGPVLPEAIYMRASTAASSAPSDNSLSRDVSTYSNDYYNNMRGYRYFCPTPAQKLKDTSVWTPTVFDTYVNTLTPSGNTYHDIGMLWGGRLLSPEGMFASENAATPNGGVIQRHLIFMTDGDAQASPCDYTAYGVAWWDRRTNKKLLSSCTTNEDADLTNDVNSRLATLCTSVKNEPNTLLWVISFGGQGIVQATKDRLKTCASDADHYFDATDATALGTAFQTIASRIAQLRLER